ncbi:MAG TPA: hypothetical protein PKJ99_01115 [Thermoanaerobaculales bacterium]|nr:hypothetical protein [Thermoanaerobaculales bacterium]HPA79881.1 hypothetical protein [Thermoanaerobaculales bacterium]HQL29023.1 hypothetical protein [Thermoanaerobaculales bacterium]HQN96441.1 hypothetical protein [Thermoanaerobaculales bacterium]HQP42085.1 hypothetical protein [Thermoanaerobaculales bacterium]
MPRVPRVFVEGGISHLSNRVTRGERMFADDGKAERLRLEKDLAATSGVRYDTACLSQGEKRHLPATRRRRQGRQMDELDPALAAAVPSRTVTGDGHRQTPNV